MKLALIAVTVTAAAVASATPSSTLAASPCLPKQTKIQGEAAIVDCGPATATLRYKGRTYTFKSGACLRTGKTIVLDLGTNFLGSNNHGYAHFSLTMLSTTTAPLLADSGKLVINGSARLSGLGASGTFKGANTIVHGTTSITTVPFSGSWHCGSIYQF